VASATTTVLTVATTASSALPASAPAGGDQVAVVDVPDDDVPPPGWGQWENLPTPALGGGARDEGRRLRDVGVTDARHRGLIVPRPSSRFGQHRGMLGAGAGACQRAAGPLQ
jgi:hypothetical protein